MTMISVNEFKNGLTIEYNNDLWRIVEFQHVKPGKGSAFVRSKLKSLRTGAVQEYTFRSTAKVNTADIQTKAMQYLYNDGTSFVFMDTNTYEQLEIPEAQVERESKFLKENMVVNVITHEGETLGVDLPNTVDLEVAETEHNTVFNTSSKLPYLQFDNRSVMTAENAIFPYDTATWLENWASDEFVINTADGTYVSRANK